MYEFEQSQPKSGVLHFRFPKLACCEALQLWKDDKDFALFFGGLLADCSFSAFCWENPPLIAQRLDKVFEFVLVESRELAGKRADSRPFQTHLNRAKSSVVSFPNLGGDALLVVPKKIETEGQVYAHLASFLRGASESQKIAFWQVVAHAVDKRLRKGPVWVSTAGLGVSWLHARISSTPKYYRYRDYSRL